MSEHLKAAPTPEKTTDLGVESARRSKELESRLEQAAESAKGSAESLTEIRAEISHEATQTSEVNAADTKATNSSEPVFMTRELKQQSFSQTINQVYKKLPRPEVLFSKVIHNNAVNALSEAASETIGRPSTIAGGAIFAGIGSVILLWFAKHGGFALSGYEFILLLIVGMLVGFLTEVIVRIFKRSK